MAKSILSSIGQGLLSMGSNFIDGSQRAQEMKLKEDAALRQQMEMELLNQYRREQMADSRETREFNRTMKMAELQDAYAEKLRDWEKTNSLLGPDAAGPRPVEPTLLGGFGGGQPTNGQPKTPQYQTRLLSDAELAASVPGDLRPQSGGQTPLPSVDQAAPLWQRNNNPGNMRVPGKADYQTFPDMQSGLNAIPKQLRIYQSRGITTPRQIASTWAPASDNNNTELYASILAKAAGVGPDDPLDMNNPQHVMAVTKGIAQVEGSGKAITPDMLSRAAGVAPSEPGSGQMGKQYAQTGPTTVSDASGAPQAGQKKDLRYWLQQPPEEFAKLVMAMPKQAAALEMLYKQANPQDRWEIKEGADGLYRVDKNTGRSVKVEGVTPKADGAQWELKEGGDGQMYRIDKRSGKSEPVQGFQPKPTGGKEKSPEEQTRSLREDFIKGSKSFIDSKSAYNRILTSAKDGSAAGDMSLVFAYMKMLDPGSTVREGEFAMAENARGVPESVQNMYNKILKGERLTPEQRKSFMDQAGLIYKRDRAAHDQHVKNYQGLAGHFGFDPAGIIQDYTSDIDAFEQQARSGESGQQPQGQKPQFSEGATVRDKETGKLFKIVNGQPQPLE